MKSEKTRKTLLLLVATLALLAGSVPAGAATAVAGGGGGGGGGRAATGYAPTPSTGAGTGPQAGEVDLGSFVAPVRGTAGGTRHGAATDLKGAPGCAIQCITSGRAYGRGPDVRLVVTTDTPANITIWVTRSGYTRQITSGSGQTVLDVVLADVEADTDYDAFVSASDGAGQIANRSGTFRTLRRDIAVTMTEALVETAPYGGEPFASQVWFEGLFAEDACCMEAVGGQVSLGLTGLRQAQGTDRYLELFLELSQFDDEDHEVCEVHEDAAGPEFGEFHCDFTAWAGFEGGSLDLDAGSGPGHWNAYHLDAELEVPGPYYSPLTFTVPVGVDVTWTRS